MQVLLDYHVLHRIHCRLQKSRIRSIRVMDIDLAVRYPVNTTESISKVPGGRIEIRTRTSEVREVFGYRRNLQFPPEQIDLVQEENDWFPLEPFTICQGLEEHHGFVHLVLDGS